MTPLGPGGQNGGAGLVATALVRELSRLKPALQFTLLTAPGSHTELAALDAPNVRRRRVSGPHGSRTLARRVADRLLPTEARVRVKRAYWQLRTARRYERLTGDLQPDLLLAPFTVPYFWRAGVPTVCIVYDLQHVAHPEFFSREQWLNRQQQLIDACRRADRIVCISEYVRNTLASSLPGCAEGLVTIPLGVLQQADTADEAVVDRLGLRDASFLLYPANFWPHKNHRRLFEALRIARDDQPGTQPRLVCTGAPNALMRDLERDARALLPPEAVTFAGYVSETQLRALLERCQALIFPSLYEGFGMPVLEAMAAGRPVLCSRLTSLPEVGGDAALYFDPTNPAQIAATIGTVSREPVRVGELVARGRVRAAAFGTARDMASRYDALIEQLLAARPV